MVRLQLSIVVRRDPDEFVSQMSPEGGVEMRRELNDRFLRGLKPDPEKRLEISDTKSTGLRFRLSPKGKATWVVEKRVKGGAKRKFTLGEWPKPVSLAKARAMALEIQAEAANGIDRVEVHRAEREKKRAEEAKRVPISAVLESYRELHLRSIKTGDERYRQIVTALGPNLERPITSLTRRDIQAAVDRKAQEGRRPYANRIRAALVAFSNWAFVRGYIDEPIGAGVARATREVPRDRVLSLNELHKIWRATYSMGSVWGPYFRVLILTGQRRGEVSSLKWSEVDFQNSIIVKPGSRTKNGKPHKTHMCKFVVDELRAIYPDKGNGPFVFTFDGVRPVSNPSHAKARLDDLLGSDFEPWRLHDIRTAMATALAEAGESETVVDRILNHAASGSAPSAVARVYQQSELLTERARVLERWASLLVVEQNNLRFHG